MLTQKFVLLTLLLKMVRVIFKRRTIVTQNKYPGRGNGESENIKCGHSNMCKPLETAESLILTASVKSGLIFRISEIFS